MLTIPGRIPIRIHPIFWLLMFFIGWLNSSTIPQIVAWAGVVLVSVLVHEFGHALTALAFGQKVSIDLVGLGGVTHQTGKKLKWWQEFIVVINGPIAGFLLAFLASRIWLNIDQKADTIFSFTILIMMYANVFWSVINLLPIHPLDGGKLLGIVLEAIFGIKGLKASFMIGFIFAGIIGLLFFSIGSYFNGAIFFMLAFEGYRAWQSSLHMTASDQSSDMQTKIKLAAEKIYQKKYQEAKELFQQIREETKQGVLFVTATEFLAEIYQKEGNIKEAFELLEPIQNKLSREGLRMLHQLAFQNQAWQKAAALGDETYQSYPNYNTALINSISYSLLGDIKPSTGWLQRAIDDGLPNLRAILSKPEFDNVRSSPQFQALEKKSEKGQGT